MGLHFKEGSHNPAWDDGKELKSMWKKVLAGTLPGNDRQESIIPNMKLRERHSLHATYTVTTSLTVLFDSQGTPPPQWPLVTETKRAGSDDDLFDRKTKRQCTGWEHSTVSLPGASPKLVS